MRELADAVLRGLARGDVATTFERAAAFARWRDWETTHFGAVAGPAATMGARPPAGQVQ